jgi:hypothetical protein
LEQRNRDEARVLIEFEVSARDGRILENWQRSRFPLSGFQLQVAYFAVIGLSLVWSYRHPGQSYFWVFGSAFAAFAGVVFALRHLTAWRTRLVDGMGEGRHSLHFSPAGVHHVGPAGIRQYSWRQFGGVSVLVDYVLLTFHGHGVVAIPVSALGAFGASYDEAFLAALAPMIESGQRGEV